MNARLWRTLWFQQDQPGFLARLERELRYHVDYCHKRNLQAACRLDGFSDLPWDNIFRRQIIDLNRIMFYGYTKVPAKMQRFLTSAMLPVNYHLCFSMSEDPENQDWAYRFLTLGGTVTVLFRNRPFPDTFWDCPVIDGTLDDRRWLDPPGTVIGLDPLGSMKKTTSGYVVDN